MIYLFIFFVFFPYIPILSIDGLVNTQPSALVLSIILFFYYIVIKREAMPKQFIFPIILLIIASGFFIISDMSLTSIRSFLGYLSLFFISYTTYILLKKNNGISDNHIKLVIIIWGLAGLIQTYVYPDFLSSILPRFATTEKRGVVGFATEPSHYGTICIFLLFYSIFHIKSYLYSFFLLFQIIFFAKSGIAVLLLSLAFVIYIIIYRKFLIGGLIIMITIVFMQISFKYYIQNTRLEYLIQIAINSPNDILSDVSIMDRFSAIYFSLKGFIEHWGVPMGMNAYHEAGATSTGRILSGYGSALFELGIFAFVIPIFFTIIICNYFSENKKMGIVISTFFALMMFTPVPMALPYVSFFGGYLIYYKHKNRKDIVIQINK
jgi:hypothetical protein